jgi:hypothetical protein
MARRDESVLVGLRELGEEAARQPLREALQGWSGLERAAQRRRLAGVLERIDYAGRRSEARLRWRTSVIDAEPISIPIRNRAAVHPSRPPGESSAPAIAGRLPRITRLLALAVRFERLLQGGTVRDMRSWPGWAGFRVRASLRS